MKRFLSLIAFVAVVFTVAAQQRTLHLRIEGVRYDSVMLGMYYNPSTQRFVAKGIVKNGNEWTFQIPDSIFNRYYLAYFYGFPTDSVRKVFWFMTEGGECNAIYFGDKKDVQLNIRYSYQPPEKWEGLSTDYGAFFIEKGTDEDTRLSVAVIHNQFKLSDDPDNPLEKLYNYYFGMVKQYPNSYTLAKIFNMYSDWYSADDLISLYHAFSNQIKESVPGKEIIDYATRKKNSVFFENDSLPDWETGKIEPMIKDAGKYNLVVFSASWCGPCHKMIPLLKEIYGDLKENLEITYVSTDKKETVENWKNLMRKEEIPWRSLLAAENKDRIAKQYFVSGIPLSYLVYPDGKYKKIEIRDENQKTELYELIKNDVNGHCEPAGQ